MNLGVFDESLDRARTFDLCWEIAAIDNFSEKQIIDMISKPTYRVILLRDSITESGKHSRGFPLRNLKIIFKTSILMIHKMCSHWNSRFNSDWRLWKSANLVVVDVTIIYKILKQVISSIQHCWNIWKRCGNSEWDDGQFVVRKVAENMFSKICL